MPDRAGNNSQPKRLTPEAMERHIQRVTTTHPPPEIRDYLTEHPSKKIPKEEMERMTDRLYTQSLQHRAQKLAEADNAAYGPNSEIGKANRKPLSPDETADTVKRLYDDTLLQKKNNMEHLQARHLFHPSEPKTLPLKDVVQHMYYDRIEAKKKTEKYLYDTYLAPTEIRVGLMSKQRLAESAKRLSTVKGS